MNCPCGYRDCDLPPCACGEDHVSVDGRCRDCDIQWLLDGMQCSACNRMRYRTDGPEPIADFGKYLWGDRCECAPSVPSKRDAKARTP